MMKHRALRQSIAASKLRTALAVPGGGRCRACPGRIITASSRSRLGTTWIGEPGLCAPGYRVAAVADSAPIMSPKRPHQCIMHQTAPKRAKNFDSARVRFLRLQHGEFLYRIQDEADSRDIPRMEVSAVTRQFDSEVPHPRRPRSSGRRMTRWWYPERGLAGYRKSLLSRNSFFRGPCRIL